jgi:hypothetical protein
MTISGERSLPGAPNELWDLLHDPDILVAAIPGCKKLELVAEDTYRGVIGAKVGPVQSQYTTTFQVQDKNRPNSYRLTIKGQGPGGFVQGNVRIELEANGDDTTTMRHDGQAQVGGKIARVGQRMVQATANMMVEKSMNALQERVEQELAPAPPPDTARPPKERPAPAPPEPLFDLTRIVGVVVAALAAVLFVTWLVRRGDDA